MASDPTMKIGSIPTKVQFSSWSLIPAIFGRYFYAIQAHLMPNVQLGQEARNQETEAVKSYGRFGTFA